MILTSKTETGRNPI